MSDEDYESITSDGEQAEPVEGTTSKKGMKTKQNTIKYESDEEKEESKKDHHVPNGVPEAQTKAVEGEVAKTEETVENNSTNNSDNQQDFVHNVIVTNASVDMPNLGTETTHKHNLGSLDEETVAIDCIEAHGLASPARSACVSPASSNGGVYSVSTNRWY